MTIGRQLRRLGGRTLARVSKNAIVLLVAQVGARAINLLLIAQLTRLLGAAALGRYLLAMTAQAITLSIADLGLNTYTTREYAKLENVQHAQNWGLLLSLRLVAALASMLTLNVLAVPILNDRWLLIAIVSPSLLPDTYNSIASALIKARQRMEISSSIQVGMRVLYALVGSLLLWRGHDEHALLATYGAVSLLGSIIFWSVLRSWRIPCKLGRLFGGWRTVLRESIPFAITSTVAMLYTRLDLLLLSFWHGDTAAGLYGAAYRIWEALGTIPSSFLDALFPALSRASTRGTHTGQLRALYRRGRQLVWVGLVILVIPAQLLAGVGSALLYGHTPDTPIYANLLRVLLLAFPFTYLYLLNGHTLYALDRQRHVTGAMVAVTIANTLGNVLLIPRWSYAGAAVTKLFSEVLLFVLLQVLLGSSWRLRAADKNTSVEPIHDG